MLIVDLAGLQNILLPYLHEGQNDQCVSGGHVVYPSYGTGASFLTGGNAGQGLFSETPPQKAQKERRGEDLKKLRSCVFRHRQLSSSTDSNSSFCNSVALKASCLSSSLPKLIVSLCLLKLSPLFNIPCVLPRLNVALLLDHNL